MGFGTQKSRKMHHISVDNSIGRTNINSIDVLDNMMHIGDGVPGIYSKYSKKLPIIDFSKQTGRPSIEHFKI